MPAPKDQGLYDLLVGLFETAKPEAGHVGGVANLTISWGYIWPDGTHDMASCSPPTNLTANQQAQIVESQYSAIQTAGGSAARWVDGNPPNIVQSVATNLGVPVGMPPDWFSTTS